MVRAASKPINDVSWDRFSSSAYVTPMRSYTTITTVLLKDKPHSDNNTSRNKYDSQLSAGYIKLWYKHGSDEALAPPSSASKVRASVEEQNNYEMWEVHFCT